MWSQLNFNFPELAISSPIIFRLIIFLLENGNYLLVFRDHQTHLRWFSRFWLLSSLVIFN